MTGVEAHPEGTVLRLRVQPGARREGFSGTHGEALKLAVTAVPERGRANEAVLALVARVLGVPRRGVRLLSGETTRDKRVLVAAAAATVEAALRPLLRGRAEGDARPSPPIGSPETPLSPSDDGAGSSPKPSAGARRRGGARGGA